jgi:hypothetical protein
MNDLKCPVHGTTLIKKDVPIFYGMPSPDSDIFEIGRKFPNHGLWSIGGCEVFDDSPENTMELVCSDCNDAAKELE